MTKYHDKFHVAYRKLMTTACPKRLQHLQGAAIAGVVGGIFREGAFGDLVAAEICAN